MEEYAEITISELAIKCRSKKRSIVFLWNEGAVYLPPLNNTNHRFISQIIFGDKKYLKLSNVKICTILYYDKIRISDLVNFEELKSTLIPIYLILNMPSFQIDNGYLMFEYFNWASIEEIYRWQGQANSKVCY